MTLIAWGCALLVSGLVLHDHALPAAIAAAGITLALFGTVDVLRTYFTALEHQNH